MCWTMVQLVEGYSPILIVAVGVALEERCGGCLLSVGGSMSERFYI